MIRMSLLAPPLDPSLNWPRDLRAGMFAVADQINSLTHEIDCTVEAIEACSSRRQRRGLEQLVERWGEQRRKLHLFFDGQVFADIARPRT